MRVALCLFGHFRTFNYCWPSLKANLIDRYKPDIFASAWTDSTGDFYPIEWLQDTYNNNGWAPGTYPVATDYVQRAIDLLQPVDFHIDHYYLHDARFAKMVEQIYKDKEGVDFRHKPKVPLSQNWMRNICVSMKRQCEIRQGWDYDVVICTRYDIEYTKPIILEELDLSVLTVPNRFSHIGTDDIWGAGPSKFIDIWGEQINRIDEIAYRDDFHLTVHEWLCKWLAYNNVPWVDSGNLGVGIRRNGYVQF
jgi:hypothetical protein